MIGGEYCKYGSDPRDNLPPGLLISMGQKLTPYERSALWKIFQAIGRVWEDLHPSAPDSSNLKSAWLDFLQAKTDSEPSYVGEYSNAVLCVDELIELYGEDEAFRRLFLENGIPDGPPATRLAHAKKYVIDEFIRVNVLISRFNLFGGPGSKGKNYKGYLGGSRYNFNPKVRAYVPESTEEK